MTWTMNPVSVVTAEQTTAVYDILTKVFQGVLDFLYTMITILVNFFTQPAVLGALAVVAIIYAAYRKLRAKKLG